MRYPFVSILLSLSFISQAQEYTARIFDRSTSQPIPYATVLNTNTSEATISDLEGNFTIIKASADDVIQISFVGYETKRIKANKLSDLDKILLKPKAQVLGEAIVFADQSYIYDLFSSIDQQKTQEPKTAKSYYLLKSGINDRQVEMVECYYNGIYSGYDVIDLKVKNGRIALIDQNQRFFVSTETSRVMHALQLFGKNNYFPISPFEVSKNKLRKDFRLSLSKRYNEDDSSAIFMINFTPRDTSGHYFEGTAWIDSLDRQLLKVKFKVGKAKVHPFLSHGNMATINNVAMEITKTFEKHGGNHLVKSIDFNYQVDYTTTDNQAFHVNSSAVLYAYDYENEFVIPRFDFTSGMYEDYRKINAIAYNKFFWSNMTEFGMAGMREENEKFIGESSLSDRQMFQKNGFFEKMGFFESPYIQWSEDRIKIKALAEPEDTPYNERALPSSKYNLKAQIYLDVNELNDSLHFLTSAVFDPFKSFYHLEFTNEAQAFFNLYFDLIEIEKRRLDSELTKCKTVEEMMSTYDKALNRVDELERQYFKDTSRGTDQEGMEKWNNVVKDKLSIDNISIYGLYTGE